VNGDRPRVALLAALRRHPVASVLPVLLLVALAITLGVSRPPNYTAETRLIVGRIDVGAPGALAGFSNATESLASAYSRAVTAEQVIEVTARRTGRPPEALQQQISATPIPESPVFGVSAVAESEDAAVALANSAGSSLIDYVRRLNRSNPDARRLLNEFKEASREVVRLSVVENRLRDRIRAGGNPVQQDALQNAASETEAAQLRRQALREGYRASQQGQSSTQLLQVLNPATQAESDRGEVLQLLLAIALVAGIPAGIGLAFLRTNRSVRQAVR